jgi:hypothetical protein
VFHLAFNAYLLCIDSYLEEILNDDAKVRVLLSKEQRRRSNASPDINDNRRFGQAGPWECW